MTTRTRSQQTHSARLLALALPLLALGCDDLDWWLKLSHHHGHHHPGPGHEPCEDASAPDGQVDPDGGEPTDAGGDAGAEGGPEPEAGAPDGGEDAGPDGGGPLSVLQVVGGREHSCVLLSNGAVRCWGSASSGRLGNPGLTSNVGDDEPPSVLSDIPLGAAATQLAAGGNHTCALLSDASVRCWGEGSAGQLGHGGTFDIGDDEPASSGVVALNQPVSAITAGSAHTCALLSTGGVRCWGEGAAGRLGYGSTSSLLAPASSDVSLGAPALQVAAGGSHTCVLLPAGSVRCWGAAALGQLGYGSTSNVLAPGADVATGGPVTQLALGSAHTCALYASGGVRCWGQGTEGVLLQPQVIPSQYGGYFGDAAGETPDQLSDIVLGASSACVQIVAGDLHNCARFAAGSVRCWGLGSEGGLGYGTPNNVGNFANPTITMDVPLGGTATALAGSNFGSCALLSSGGLRCWGENGAGQRGYGDVTGSLDDIGDDETPAAMGDVPLL